MTNSVLLKTTIEEYRFGTIARPPDKSKRRRRALQSGHRHRLRWEKKKRLGHDEDVYAKVT